MATIFVLDDSIDLLEMFEMLFKLKEFVIETASNLDSFLPKIQEVQPDLIIMDIMLGAQDGRTVCQQIKLNQDTSHIPIMVISASANKLENYHHFMADDVLEKPFAMNDLFDKVNKLLYPNL